MGAGAAALLAWRRPRRGAAQAPDADPPGRVGRLGETFGQVWLLQPRRRRLDRGRAQSADHRPATGSPPTPARAPSSSIGSTHPAARRGAPSSRSLRLDDDAGRAAPAQRLSARCASRDAQAAREFELVDRRGRASVLTRRALSLRPLRRGRAHLTVQAGQARFEGAGQRAHGRRRPARRVLDRGERRRAVQRHRSGRATPSPAGSPSATRNEDRSRVGRATSRPR